MEITANALQTVGANQNVLFTDTVVDGNCSIVHREGSGLVTLRGIGNKCRVRFKATFGANIAVPTGQNGPVSLALAINGEPVDTTTMIYTPIAVNQYGNVSSSVYLYVPGGCCSQISVENTSAGPVDVRNANLIIERVSY